MIRTLIVDDERIARLGLRTLLGAEKGFEVVGECANGLQAVERIRALRPELIFLDVQMPDLDGFGVLAALEPAELPVTVFVTAYDQYALRAFEASAIDYLLKPFDRERFTRSLRRAERFVAGDAGALRGQLQSMLRSLGGGAPGATRSDTHRILVRDRDRVYFVAAQDVEWVQSDGNYLRFAAKGATHLVRDTLTAFAARLDASRFVRVSRSALVNLDCVRELRRRENGQSVILMRDGRRIVSSRRYRQRVLAAPGKPLERSSMENL